MAKRMTRRPPQSTPPSDCTLVTALDLFLLDRRVRQASSNTLLFYNRQLNSFIRWCGEHAVTTVHEISAATLRGYLVSLQDRNLSDLSVHAAARALRAWLNFAVREELLLESPMSKVGMPRLSRRILPAFSADDVTRLVVACCGKRDRALVLFLLDTGCRASEFVALNGEDVDAATGTVRIRQGKGGKERVVFLGNEARKELMRYYIGRGGTPIDQEPVWISDTNSARLTDSGLRQILSRLGTKAAVKECHPHTFRRTFALFSLRNGMSIYHLQRLMGHSDIAILRQYLALVDDDLEAAHARYGVVDGLAHNPKSRRKT